MNRAARVRELARAGEILLSASTADVARLALPAGVELIALGPHALRGLEGSDEIAAVVTEGVSAPPDPARSPYPGLASFGSDDADLFFGREEVVERCLELFDSRRFVAVVGASGSGKSSVALAGIAPRLTEVVVVRPGVAPGTITRCEAGIPWHDSAVLIVDQLEELVTLVRRPGGAGGFRRRRRRTSRRARRHRASRLVRRVRCLPRARRPAGVQPSAPRAARRRRPARAPCRNRLDDAGSSSKKALPKSSPPNSAKHPARCRCSVTPSGRRGCAEKGGPSRVAGYRASGGVRSAIATTAEQALAALDDERPGRRPTRPAPHGQLRPEGDDTRRWASDARLTDVDPQRTDDVIATLTDSRLLVVDHDQITVAHEALLRAWPRLDAWIAEERADLIGHQELREATERWATGGRNDADLYRGLRLDAALDLTRRDGLSRTGTRVHRSGTTAPRP